MEQKVLTIRMRPFGGKRIGTIWVEDGKIHAEPSPQFAGHFDLILKELGEMSLIPADNPDFLPYLQEAVSLLGGGRNNGQVYATIDIKREEVEDRYALDPRFKRGLAGE